MGSNESDFSDLVAEYAGIAPNGSPELVVGMAQNSLPEAIDLLWEIAALSSPDCEELARLAVEVFAYVTDNSDPRWLADIGTADQLVDRLATEVGERTPGEFEEFGAANGWEAIRAGLYRLQTDLAGRTGKRLSDKARQALMPKLSTFLGDVLIYLHQQSDAGGEIRARVSQAIIEASKLAEEGDPLVIVAHSMGGNIVYDLLTTELGALDIPLLVTAGTQVGFFEELGLFRASTGKPGTQSEQLASKPANINRWINIFDFSDLLAFRIAPVIGGVDDFCFRTGSILKSHSRYFLHPGFHGRLTARVHGKGPQS
ncbi:hypothetical protein AB0L82_35525 [Nocardia sp. NPDC052001]|uniref:hypothetical protein n=1 Tax=Nocardia sp. NPDC052001 TaxID=3154853 RepID=UPI00343B8448